MLESFIFPLLPIKTDSQFASSQLSLHCLKLGHHISRHNYSQNLSETNLLSVAVLLLCMSSELSAVQAEIKNWERVERKSCESCGRASRSIGDKHMSNKPRMKPEWSLLWGPGLLLTNVLLTSHKQPVIEIPSVSDREEECERWDMRGRRRGLKYRSHNRVYALQLMMRTT